VPVSTSQLTKIGYYTRLIGDWPAKIVFGINERLGVKADRKKNGANKYYQAARHRQIYKAVVEWLPEVIKISGETY